MDHFNKSLTAVTSLGHQRFWGEKMQSLEKFNNQIIVWLLRIHISNEAVCFCVLTGELLAVFIECYQLRGGGRHNERNFQTLLFSFTAANNMPRLNRRY